MASADLPSLSPSALCDYLAARGVTRFSLVPGADGAVVASPPELAPLAEWAQRSPDFDAHEAFFAWVSPRTGVLQAAAVHRTRRGQAAGGVRWWHYDTVADWVSDGLRLSRGMTHKNALAGIWWGGGKGVMCKGTGAEGHDRVDVYADYGRLVTSLQGCYVTAEDVGTSVEDMASVFSTTRFTTCIPASLGGSGNPSVPTARGVLAGIEAGLEHLGMGGVEGKAVAIQGLGHVGLPLATFLAERGARRIVATDIFEANVEAARAALGDLGVGELELRVVARGDNSVLAADVDVVSPNATGGVLNPATAPTIRAPLVCGAANNQLADDGSDDRLLAEAGVLYLPDFLVNRMGIVSCADEGAGSLTPDPLIERHLGTDWEGAIKPVAKSVLAEAAATGRTPASVALERAEALSMELHPLHGHRGKAIVESLVRDGWATKAAEPPA